MINHNTVSRIMRENGLQVRTLRRFVLVTLGVCANGQRVALDLRLSGVESEQAWLDAVLSLALGCASIHSRTLTRCHSPSARTCAVS